MKSGLSGIDLVSSLMASPAVIQISDMSSDNKTVFRWKTWLKIMFYKGLSFGSKGFTKELKTVECTSFLGQTS